jgi:hypothetical protein
MLQALRPEIPIFTGPFERWVREHGAEYAGRLGLVLANPPYGACGVSVTEDPDRSYREKAAYAYFLRRALDLLAPNGLGVLLVPSGFLTGGSAGVAALREKVLRRHHLAAAYRLPSAIFPGAMLVTDLLFFRARGGELAEVDSADRFVLEGRYFRERPDHVLGTEVGKDAGDDDQTARPRWGYQVVGTFDRLPDLVERPICGACAVTNVVAFPTRPAKAGLARRLEEAPAGLSEPAATAVALGLRVDRYLAAASAQTTDEHVQLWPELHEALVAWTAKHGAPLASAELRKLVKDGHSGAERFVQAFTKAGALIAGLAAKPTWTPRYAGKSDDLVALAEWVYRTKRHLTMPTLADALVAQSGLPADRAKATVADRLPELLDAGWCVDGDAWDELVPERDYVTGHLWPKHDRAMRLEPGRLPKRVPVDRIAAQARKLADAIQPAVLDDIACVSPRQGWVPLDLVADRLRRCHGPTTRQGTASPLGGLVGAVGEVSLRGRHWPTTHPRTASLLVGWSGRSVRSASEETTGLRPAKEQHLRSAARSGRSVCDARSADGLQLGDPAQDHLERALGSALRQAPATEPIQLPRTTPGQRPDDLRGDHPEERGVVASSRSIRR